MRVLTPNLLFTALLLIGLTACSDDEIEKPVDEIDEISHSDSDAVSESLQFKNVSAVSKEGQIPTASSDAGAPKLNDDEDYDNIISISGSEFVLEIRPESDAELKGLYLQVDGAQNYYDISLEPSSTNGRKATRPDKKRRLDITARVQESIDEILITLPKEMSSGKFCLTFAVYDVEGQVSNHINACVEVRNPAGNNSSFLSANGWEMVYRYDKEIDQGTVYEDYDTAGVLQSNTYSVSIQCNDASYQEFEVVDERIINYSRITFSDDGTVQIENSESEKWLDHDNSSCDQLVYFEEDFLETGRGSWSYDSETQTLTLAVEYVYENEAGDEESDVEIGHYHVELTNDGMLKVLEEGGSDGDSYHFETYFRPRK